MESNKFREMIQKRINSLYHDIEFINRNGEIMNAEFMINLKQSAIAELQGLRNDINEYERMS